MKAARSRNQPIARIAFRVTIALGLGLVFMHWVFENWMVYPTWSIESEDDRGFVDQCEEIEFQSKDGTELHGLYFPHPRPRQSIVFFHGNGEDVSHLVGLAEDVRQDYDVSVFVFDYRGYGKSRGKPSEHGILEDGRAAVQWMADRNGLTVEQVVLWGRSLGGAVAVDIASKQGARGLILDRTFSSLPDVAAFHYPYLPVRWLMRNRYESAKKIADYHGPLLQTHGMNDQVVPMGLAKKLFEACPSRSKKFVELPMTGHNSPNPPVYFESFRAFIDDLE